MRHVAVLILLISLLAPGPGASGQTPAKNAPAPTAIQKEMLAHLDAMRPDLIAANQDIWTFAELGLEEYRSAARLVGILKRAGFKVTEGVADMPTAFVAEYGSGKPVIGILAEYDALPELSQEATGLRKPAAGRTTGHGCGHCALGTAAVGAAVAIKEVYDKHSLQGTIRVYGTPAEETLIGKIYMLLAGLFGDLDACLHWHPGSKNSVSYSTSKAMISARFTFAGIAAHASGSPDKGKSALDGVELMNLGANFMREHVKPTSRTHYVITRGGSQPNVVPATAQVWYYTRANEHRDAVMQFEWLKDIAEGAAKMSRTKVQVAIETDCHDLVPNLPISKVVHRNLKMVGAPKFDDADRSLASQLQASIRNDFELKETKPLHDVVDPLPEKPEHGSGSTDVGDVSWHVPTSGLTTACFAAGSPGHSWQNVAAIGSPIGHKGMMVAAKVLALSAVDLLQDAKLLQEARADFQERMKDRKYMSVIPKGQKAPKSIR
jgi:aminobenzoyl-glutamate utilization protein B